MKQSIRSGMLKKRELLSEDEVEVKSSIIQKRLFRSFEYQSAEEIFTYISYGKEVNTYPMIQDALRLSKKVYAPKIIRKGIMEFYQVLSIEELAANKFGILEPTKECVGELKSEVGKQLFLVPGVAFDEECNRLGYGGGYYDRYITKHSHCQVFRIALCYEVQVLQAVPVEEYDQKVDRIITEQREINRISH